MEQIYIKDEPIAGPSNEQGASDVSCTKLGNPTPDNSQTLTEASRTNSEVSSYSWTDARECILIDAVKKYPVLWHPQKSTFKDLSQEEKKAITDVTDLINISDAGASPEGVLHHWAVLYYNAQQAHAAGCWADYKHAQRMDFCFCEIKVESPSSTDIVTTGEPKERGREKEDTSAPRRPQGQRERRPPRNYSPPPMVSKAEMTRLARLGLPRTDDRVSSGFKPYLPESVSDVSQCTQSDDGRSSGTLKGKSSLTYVNHQALVKVKGKRSAIKMYRAQPPTPSVASLPQTSQFNNSRFPSGTHPDRITPLCAEEHLCELEPLPHSCFTPDVDMVVSSPPHDTNHSSVNSHPALKWLKLRELPERTIKRAIPFQPADVGLRIEASCYKDFDEIRALMLFMNSSIWHTMALETNRCYDQHCQMLKAAGDESSASGPSSAAHETPVSEAASCLASNSSTRGEPSLTKHRRKRDGPDCIVNPSEIWAYIGILLLLGVDPPPALEFRWDLDSHMRSEIIDSTMSLERFQHINTYFRLVNSEDLPARDSPHYLTARVAPLLLPLQEKSASVYKASSQNLSIDESSLDWRVNSALRQHDATKPHNYEIKAYKLVESSTGYLSSIFLNDNADHSEEKIVMDLLSSSLYKPDEGYSLFLGQSLASPDLLWRLRKEVRFNVNGPCDPNHPNFPLFLANSRSLAMAALASDGETTIVGLKLKDSFLFSTEYAVDLPDLPSSEISQPASAVAYSRHAVGVAKNDAMVAQYSPCKISSKLWHKLILYLFSTAVTNAWIVYNMVCPSTYDGPSGHLSFRCELGLLMISLHKPRNQGMVSKFFSLATQSLVKSQHHLPAVTPPFASSNKTRQLRLRCRWGGCRRHSNIYCVKCQLPFCLKNKYNCFIKYHEQLARAGRGGGGGGGGDKDLELEENDEYESDTDTADSGEDEDDGSVGLPAKRQRESDH